MKERFNGTGGNMNRIEEYMKGLADVMGVKLEYECGVHSFGFDDWKRNLEYRTVQIVKAW